MNKAIDKRYMALAVRLARRGLYSTPPNPRVGCVLVRDQQLVGEGWHKKTGGPHAEIMALAEAGEQARGADVYLTLAPCSHHGQPPPCSTRTPELSKAVPGRDGSAGLIKVFTHRFVWKTTRSFARRTSQIETTMERGSFCHAEGSGQGMCMKCWSKAFGRRLRTISGAA